MKDVFGKVVLVAILLGIAFWVFSSKLEEHESKAAKKELETEKRTEVTELVTKMAAKHNAVTDWEQALGNEERILIDFTYTIEVEDALLRTDGRPILFFGSINDIVKKDDNYIMYCDMTSNIYSSADIRFALECTAQQVGKMMEAPERSFMDEFAVVARISEVEKIRFQLTASSYYVYDEQVEVKLEPSNIFVATGSCLDLMFVGSDGQADFLETINLEMSETTEETEKANNN